MNQVYQETSNGYEFVSIFDCIYQKMIRKISGILRMNVISTLGTIFTDCDTSKAMVRQKIIEKERQAKGTKRSKSAYDIDRQ